MTRIFFVAADGYETPVDATDGQSVMEAAVQEHIEGIIADCGGACACATCHVYVQKNFLHKLDVPDAHEEAMLDFISEDRQENSRLSCQLEVSAALNGARFFVPESQ